jgi:hypothetical protein
LRIGFAGQKLETGTALTSTVRQRADWFIGFRFLTAEIIRHSLESAVAFPRVRDAVDRLLTNPRWPRLASVAAQALQMNRGSDNGVAPDLINESCTLYECELAILPPFNGHFPLWSQK